MCGGGGVYCCLLRWWSVLWFVCVCVWIICFFSSFVFTWWRGKSLWGGLLVTRTSLQWRACNGGNSGLIKKKKKKKVLPHKLKCKGNSKHLECFYVNKLTHNKLFIRIPSVLCPLPYPETQHDSHIIPVVWMWAMYKITLLTAEVGKNNKRKRRTKATLDNAASYSQRSFVTCKLEAVGQNADGTW